VAEQILMLKVLDKSGVVLDTQAQSISTMNGRGRFDILPGHTNFISLIQNNVSYLDKEGKVNEFKISQSLLKVVENKVEIFLSI
jgi:F0F1-type ATP synthase epsilon subunit